MKGVWPRSTYTVGNLLPASTASPFPFVAEAILIHVDNTLAALFGQSSHGIRSIAEFLQGSWSVPVHDDVHVCEELFKLLASSFGLQV